MKENDVRETPRAEFEEWNRRWAFELDACATSDNALCSVYYTLAGLFGETGQLSGEDGLKGPWLGRVWCNPPFSELAKWVRKATAEKAAGNADLIVMLIPANRTDQAWWHDVVVPQVEAGRLKIEWLRGRPRFLVDGAPILDKNGRIGSPRFPCCLLIWS
jgi:phage N-6-adenine-methyltransferase